MERLPLRTSATLIDRRPDGAVLLTSADPLPTGDLRAAAQAMAWAERHPDRLALADRRGETDAWRPLTYGDLKERSARIGQALLNLGAGPDRPVMLVSENRIEAALTIFAAYRAGIPIAPVTPAYSSGRGDLDRLNAVMQTLKPAVIVADMLTTHQAALAATTPSGTRLIGIAGEGANFDSLLGHAAGAEFKAAEAAVNGDTIAKLLFTSGSTGTPKGVINTHRMLASNIAMLRHGWPFLDEEPPVVADWLPWNHTFGGNYVFNGVLSSGGSLYIDDGKPLPHLIGRSIANAAGIGGNLHINAPRGLDMVARGLAADAGLAEAFFERLGLVFFASSGLPARIRDEWRKLIDRHARRPVAFCSAWGTTETAPMATALNFEAPEINNIGAPVPGVTIKLAPHAGRLELRVKGPNVTPGYYGRPDLTDQAFDEEGFLKTGDVARLARPEDPSAGILIEGRIAEDFKLSTGVWVNVNGVRSQLLELAGPIVRDLVLSGPNRDDLAALIFLDPDACQRLTGAPGDCQTMAEHPAVKDFIGGLIGRYNQTNPGSSRKINRHILMPRLLDPAAGELTEKGTVSQKVVLSREAAICEALHTSGLEAALWRP